MLITKDSVKRSFSWCRFTLLIILLTIASHTAASQDGGVNDESAAREMFKKGSVLFQDGKFAEAAEAFRAAYALKPNWKLHYNIAQSEASARHHGRAMSAFQSYLAHGGDDIVNERRDEVVAEIERLTTLVGYVAVKAPDGAEVEIDGLSHGKTPLSGDIPISVGGIHILHVKLATGESLPERQVRVGSGQTQKVVFKGDSTVEESIGKTEDAAVPEEKTRSPIKIAGWSLFGVGAATLVGAGVVGGLALSTNREVDQKCPKEGCYESDHDLLERRKKLGLTADVLLINGCVVTAAGGILLLVNHLKRKKAGEREARVELTPFVGRTGAMTTLRVTF